MESTLTSTKAMLKRLDRTDYMKLRSGLLQLLIVRFWSEHPPVPRRQFVCQGHSDNIFRRKDLYDSG